MNPQSDYRKRLFPTKVLTLDNQVLATGLSKLEADGKEGWFVPDSASLVRQALGESTYPELLLVPETLQPFRVLNFRRLADTLTVGPWGEVVENQRFYFEVPPASSIGGTGHSLPQ